LSFDKTPGFRLYGAELEGVRVVNKTELVNAFADATGENKSRAADLVDKLFDCITDALKKGDDVRLPAFGVFAVADAPARVGRRPGTSEEMHIPATRRAKFRPGKALKEAVASGR
jgi:DNA-binding protein HU-beta